MSVTISITGQKEIDNVLRMMPRELSHAVLGAAHLAAAKPLIEKEKLLAPEGPTGNLVDSIGGVKMSAKRTDNIGEVRVGPRRGGRHKGFHGLFVNDGTKRRQTKTGANRGVMPAEPFAQPAFEQTKNTVEKGIAANIGKQVIRVMKKYTG